MGSTRTRFFMLGSGYRRRPRIEADDLVLLDHCGLTRRSLYRVWRWPAAAWPRMSVVNG